MKRVLLFFAFFLTCLGNVTPTYAVPAYDEKKEPTLYEPIIVRKEPTNFHRSLEAPIYAYYAAGTITIDFVENIGVATIAVQNLTAGGQVVELIDTGVGNVVLDIESILTFGDYYLSITTMSGDIYYAEFTLE
ncbi:MAG: DUF3244 domain-containing protein [Bacteroidales bacterium]|nr:DUF3244 domain-containing protein [Bacteroidales bacterium]